MIESLKYVVTFNTTGRTLKNHLKFKPGITVIKGENESGKSFVLEMIRYALFGTAALRGDRSDYDKLDVTLVITVKGKQYTIVRKGNKATVNINEAVGTTATNAFIRSLLGFGLDVFDIAGNANQGELDKLTKDMGPTERRKIIDDVTGLSQFEKAEKDCREESNAFRRMADALEAQLVEPIEPVQPEDYEPSVELKVRLDAQIRAEAMRDAFEWMDEPVEPTPPKGSDEAIDHEQDRAIWLSKRDSIVSSLNKIPEVPNDYTRDELNRFEAYYAQEDRGPLPAWLSESGNFDAWRAANLVRAREAEPLKCPECGTIVSGRELPEQPPLTNAELDLEIARQRAWEGREFDHTLSQPPISRPLVREGIAAYSAQHERTFLEQQLAELGDEPADRSEEAAAWEQYASDHAKYREAEHAYGNWLMKKQIVDELPQPEEFLSERYQLALSYETLMARYEASVEAYDKQKEQLEGAKQKRDAYKRGSDALKDARKEVKQFLVPSLSKVSSHLLTEMTDGERRHIFIDEDFNIWVDKQPVKTLSGSGVSVVNLALRIALGQVLTQSVVPIFLADEIDANMAAKRTKATHDSLKRLRSKLKQIIVVTHKDFEGDHTICLS